MVLSLLFLAVAAQAAVAPFYPCAIGESAGDSTYLVLFHHELAPRADDMQAWVSKVLGDIPIGSKWGFGEFAGFSAVLTPDQMAKAQQQPEVMLVQENCVHKIPEYTQQSAPVDETQVATGAAPPGYPTWGQKCISATSQPYSNASTTYTPVSIPAWTTLSSMMYVVDTGILCSHVEFTLNGATGNRCTQGPSFVSGTTSSVDNNGHGTHCAGTIAGYWIGVNRALSVTAVKVLNAAGSGTTTGIIDGINWSVNDAKGKGRASNGLSMSLGGATNTALNTAVNNAVAAGFLAVVAAGNENANGNGSSPCNAAQATCVGAATSALAWASYSNYGTIVVITGPGSDVYSAWYTSTTAYNTISGTSMATPHVAGVAAVYGAQVSGLSQATFKSSVQSKAFKNALSGSASKPGTPNNLLKYNLA